MMLHAFKEEVEFLKYFRIAAQIVTRALGLLLLLLFYPTLINKDPIHHLALSEDLTWP